MAVNGSIDGERRRGELVELLNNGGEVSIEAARARFDVSAMTIRRDLEMLESAGLLRRVRGGAIAAPAPRSYGDRLLTRTAAKRIIAKKALELVPRRGAVAFDASTTVHQLADSLEEPNGLVVSTNSVETFQTLSRIAGVEAHLTGGSYEPVTGSLVGPIAHAGAGLLNTLVFFTSADSVEVASGTSEATLAEAAVKQRLAASADRTVLCVDSSKLDRRSPGAALQLGDIHTMITDLDPSDARLEGYREHLDVL